MLCGDGRATKAAIRRERICQVAANCVALCGGSAAQSAPNSGCIVPSELQGVLHEQSGGVVAVPFPTPTCAHHLAAGSQYGGNPFFASSRSSWRSSLQGPLQGSGCRAGLAARWRRWAGAAAAAERQQQQSAPGRPASLSGGFRQQRRWACHAWRTQAPALGRPWQAAVQPPLPAATAHCSCVACPLLPTHLPLQATPPQQRAARPCWLWRETS